MSKLEQVVRIEPQNELKFKGPFHVPVTSYMKLTNPSERKVMFKIKTTAPKKYCVRPNSGILDANKSTEIAICLQPFTFDPAEKNKHKFMVQTVFAPDGDINLDQLWKDISPDQLMDSKLKCLFEMPEEQQEAAEEPNKIPKSVPPPSNISNAAEPELQKAAQELQQLREEISRLKQENLKNKEEILHMKQQGVAKVMAKKYVPPVQEQTIPMTYLALAVFLALIGIILGKFAL